MFIRYNPDFQYRWNKIIASGFNAFADELSELALQYKVNQCIEGRYIIWKNASDEIESMFAHIIDATDLDGSLQCMKRSEN